MKKFLKLKAIRSQNLPEVGLMTVKCVVDTFLESNRRINHGALMAAARGALELAVHGDPRDDLPPVFVRGLILDEAMLRHPLAVEASKLVGPRNDGVLLAAFYPTNEYRQAYWRRGTSF